MWQTHDRGQNRFQVLHLLFNNRSNLGCQSSNERIMMEFGPDAGVGAAHPSRPEGDIDDLILQGAARHFDLDFFADLFT
jgi:hypothetical protein